MTTVSGCPTTSTPSRGWAERAATCAATKSFESVRLMKPGPLTSTSEQMSSSEAAATTSSANWRGGRPTSLANARAPFAW